MNVKNSIKKGLQDQINRKNQKRLRNKDVTIISSNCTGGFLYHWLGLQFKSPFINLYMTPDDFIVAIEHFEEFIAFPVSEKKDANLGYPVGIGAFDTLIHFMHYATFEDAIKKWNERKSRINSDNMCIILSNWGGNVDQLARFDRLPYEHKVAFTNKEYPQYKSAFYLKGYKCEKGNVYATQSITGKRYIDQFDYVEFFNRITKCEDKE